MPMTTRYTVIDGEIIAETRNGVRREYVPDSQGSTVALLDDTQAITDTFDYWPYGEEAGRTGTTPTPFRYVGTRGYYRDSATRTYVRARVLNKQQGRWLTEDPITIVMRYAYAGLRPTVETDPTGLLPPQCHGDCSPEVYRQWGDICRALSGLSPAQIARINACMAANTPGSVQCSPFTPALANCLRGKCPRVIMKCQDEKCKPNDCATTEPGGSCTIHLCIAATGHSGCGDLGGDTSLPVIGFNILHELGHCCGVKHTLSPGKTAPSNWQCNDIMACCIYQAIWKPNSPNACTRDSSKPGDLVE